MSSAVPRDELPPNKRAGVDVERAVVDLVDGLRRVPDGAVEHYDLVAVRAVAASRRLPFVGLCLLEAGHAVEVKSARRRYADGKRGRFYVRREQHEELLEEDAVYLFVVRDEQGRVLAMKVVPSWSLDDVLGEWRNGGEGRADYRQLAWSRIFEPERVDETPETTSEEANDK